MRVVITGASGNVGTSLLHSLAGEDRVQHVVGIARRVPQVAMPKVEWARADVAEDDLVPLLRGADAVVHLAWRIQPSRRLTSLWRTNVLGTERVARAAVEAGVPALLHASSIGVYSPGPKDRAVREDWPRRGIPSSFYSRHKVEAEDRLDQVEADAPGMRIVRIRNGLVFNPRAAEGVRRLFAGPFLPTLLLKPSRVRLLPDIPGLRVQALTGDDIAQAYHRALVRDVSGPFNVAAEPVLDARTAAAALGARRVPVPAAAARAAADLSYRLHLHPTPPGWFDMGMNVPIMDTSRVRAELGWRETASATEALRMVLEGLHRRQGEPTPPLSPATSGPLRSHEVSGGMGEREGL
jgi:UDP-glucose 4-epimerase